MSLIGDATALATAAGIGSTNPQFISRSGERRTLRADVCMELSQAVELRWEVIGDDAAKQKRGDDLRAARQRFIAAAMLARLPRALAEEYTDGLVIRRLRRRVRADDRQ